MIISVNPDVNFIHLIPKWPPPEVAQCIDRDIRANSLSVTIKLYYAKAIFLEKLKFLSSTKLDMIEDYYALVPEGTNSARLFTPGKRKA